MDGLVQFCHCINRAHLTHYVNVALEVFVAGPYVPGLAGVPATRSNICFIDGEQGILEYRGIPIEQLANQSTFLETAYLLISDHLPTKDQLERFSRDITQHRRVKYPIRDMIKCFPDQGHPMDALQACVAGLGLFYPLGNQQLTDESYAYEVVTRLLAKLPTIVAMFHQMRQGNDPVPPRDDLGHSANFLYMLTGHVPDPRLARIFDVCLILHAEHTVNASTFGALVTASTLADPYTVIASALGTLSGPLHGGANEAALQMFQEIGDPEQVTAYIKQRLANNQKIMGLGHRVYKVKDPRAVVLQQLSTELFDRVGYSTNYQIALEVERVCNAVLSPKRIFPNMEFFSGLVYEKLGIPADCFTPVFAMARVAGWLAHWKEQLKTNRIFRPTQIYVGLRDQPYASMQDRFGNPPMLQPEPPDPVPVIPMTSDTYSPGLAGVPATRSNISYVDGTQGILEYRGIRIDQLATHSTFLETAYLLIYGYLPTHEQLVAFEQETAQQRRVKYPIRDMIKCFPDRGHPMDALQSCVAGLGLFYPLGDKDLTDPQYAREAVINLIAKLPTIVAMFHQMRQGNDPVPPREDLSHSANFLYMLTGRVPDPRLARIFDVCLITHAEHTVNASTFGALVTASTLADPYTVITSAVGTLAGPLHGGANEEVLKMIEDLGTVERVRPFIEQQLARKGKIMGLGHRVYKVKDPRAQILQQLAEELFRIFGPSPSYPIAQEIEAVSAELLAHKGIYPNVDFYSGLVYEKLEIPTDCFTPVFAMARVAGWLAHWKGQLSDNRIFRPTQIYTGLRSVPYVPIYERSIQERSTEG